MARITVEDCLRSVDNRFALIHLAAKRVRQLRKGAEPLVVCKNKDTVTALREIAAGSVLQAKSTLQAPIPETAEMPFFIPLSGEEASADTEIDVPDAEQVEDSKPVEEPGLESTEEEDPA